MITVAYSQSRGIPFFRFRAFHCRLAAFTVALFFGNIAPTISEKSAISTVDMSVTYKGGVNHKVEIAIVNKGKNVIECMEAWLPWRHEYSITLILVKSDATRELIKGRVSPIDDPGPQVVKLFPSETLKGEFDLIDRYPNIQHHLAKSGIDVFYAYELDSLDGKVGKRIGGWFHIPNLPLSNPLTCIDEFRRLRRMQIFWQRQRSAGRGVTAKSGWYSCRLKTVVFSCGRSAKRVRFDMQTENSRGRHGASRSAAGGRIRQLCVRSA